jgi:hypothetical protein
MTNARSYQRRSYARPDGRPFLARAGEFLLCAGRSAAAVLILATVVITAMGCAGTTQPGVATEAPDTDGVLRLVGRFAMAHACPISESLALTNAHVTDVKPFTAAEPLPLMFSDGLGHNGMLSPLLVSIARDLAVMQSAKPLARWYRIAAEAPTPGDRLLTIGYDWRRERDIFATRTFTVQLLRIVARSLIFVPGTERGASGACVFNMRGEVVAINAWGVPSDDGGKGGAAPGVWGETFEEAR